MELKYRKLIANGALPKFDLGLTPNSLPDINPDSLNAGMMKSGQFVVNKDGKLEAKTILGQGKGGAGSFLKNNAGGIANAAMSALNFASTIGGLSKNTMTADEMMGSGGQVENNANGISYQESRVDANGIQDRINAQASAATMGGVTSGASLGGSLGSLFGPLGTGIGTVAGGLLGGVAGFFGGKSAKREAERQKEIAINRTNAMNAQNRETAYTIGLRNEFNRENRTGTEQSLFHAAKGKESSVNPNTGETYNDYIVNTAFGKVKAPQNAWVSAGEVIRSADGSLYRVPQTNRSGNPDKAMPRFAYGIASNKKFKADTERAHLMPGDSVYSNIIINPETGNTIADDAASYAMAGQLDRLDMNQNVGRMMQYAGKRKESNVLPGYLGGTRNFTDIWNKQADELTDKWYMGNNTNVAQNTIPIITNTPQAVTSSTITPATNTGTSGSKTPGFLSKLWGGIKNAGSGLDFGNIAQLVNAYSIAAQRDARAEGLRAPKSFIANPYEQDALQQLNKLHSDYYPVWSQQREGEARAWNRIRSSGGLSAGQEMLGAMGLANLTQQNMQQALFEHQGRENALRAQAAKEALQAGNQSAARQQQAYQWDEDILARGHAAQDNKWETSAYDRQNGLTQFFKNLWEKNQFDRTMNLYESNQKIEKDKIKTLLEHLGTKQNPEVEKATIAPQTVAIMQKLWNRNPDTIDLGELELPEFAITPAKKVAKPKVTKRRTAKRGGKK